MSLRLGHILTLCFSPSSSIFASWTSVGHRGSWVVRTHIAFCLLIECLSDVFPLNRVEGFTWSISFVFFFKGQNQGQLFIAHSPMRLRLVRKPSPTSLSFPLEIIFGAITEVLSTIEINGESKPLAPVLICCNDGDQWRREQQLCSKTLTEAALWVMSEHPYERSTINKGITIC